MDTNKANHRFFYGYIIAAAGFITWFFGWGTYVVCFGVFFKPLLVEFHWRRAEISLAYSIFLFTQAALGITMGWLTDKLGPRILVTIIGSCLGWSLILVSQVSSLWQFVISFAVVGGIGASILNVPIMATVTRWFVKRRGLMTGIVQSGIGIGGFFLAPFTGWLVLHYGWRTASIILGFMTAALMILAGSVLVRDPGKIGQSPDGIWIEIPHQMDSGKNHNRYPRLPLNMWMRSPSFWMLTGIYASIGYIRSTFTAHVAAHVQDLGFSLSDGATVLAIIAAGGILGRIGMGRLGDMIGNRKTLIISYTTMTLIIIWLLRSARLWELYLFGIVYGFGWGGLAVVRFAITAEVFGLASVGLIMGVLGFSDSLAATFSSYFGGFVFDRMGNYNAAFILCIAISMLGLFLSWRLRPLQAKHEEA